MFIRFHLAGPTGKVLRHDNLSDIYINICIYLYIYTHMYVFVFVLNMYRCGILSWPVCNFYCGSTLECDYRAQWASVSTLVACFDFVKDTRANNNNNSKGNSNSNNCHSQSNSSRNIGLPGNRRHFKIVKLTQRQTHVRTLTHTLTYILMHTV